MENENLEVIEFKGGFAGTHISSVCKQAVDLATKQHKIVRFDFNGTEVLVNPEEDPEVVEKRWSDDMQAASKRYFESPEYKERKLREEGEEERKRTATIIETAQTEAGDRPQKPGMETNGVVAKTKKREDL